MTCSDVERVLPELLDNTADGAFQRGGGALPADFDAHLKSCPACSELVSDLRLIASEARQLAASEEPAPRLWLRIAAELRAEGLISDPLVREPESTPARPGLIPTLPRRRWTSTAWWLAPVAAALLAAGAYVLSHKPVPQVAKQAPAAPVTAVAKAVPETPSAAAHPNNSPSAPVVASEKAPQKPVRPARTVEPAPSAEDQQFLSVVSTLGPATRATYENQLQAVNADIRETQAYVDRNPGDEDARQHLMDAYQQKALLYQIALDRIQ